MSEKDGQHYESMLPENMPSRRDTLTEEVPADATPRTDSAFRWSRRTLGCGGALLIVGAFSYGIYGALHGEGPFAFDDSKDARKTQAGPLVPGVSLSPSISVSPSPSATISRSPSPSASRSPSPSPSASASPSASRSTSPSASVSASESLSPTPTTEESPTTSPTAEEPCRIVGGNVLTLCSRNVSASEFVGYRTLRDRVPIWNPLIEGAHVTAECQAPGFALVDDQSRPVGQQAAYVPVAALAGDLYNVPSC